MEPTPVPSPPAWKTIKLDKISSREGISLTHLRWHAGLLLQVWRADVGRRGRRGRRRGRRERRPEDAHDDGAELLVLTTELAHLLDAALQALVGEVDAPHLGKEKVLSLGNVGFVIDLPF